MTRASDLLWPLLVIAGVTLWRVVALWFNQVDLFMDEAQYWLWGQEPAFGYFSKPPLVGWAIRASVELGGSDAAFWVRLPGPLAHGVAGVLISLAAMRVWPRQPGAWAGAVYVSLPGIAILSQFISTDDLLLPCVALALWAWLSLCKRPGAGWAVMLGAAIGLGMMAKYAMIYVPVLIVLAVILGHGRTVPLRHFAIAAGVAAVLFAPNVWWNVQNGLITLSHTADNAGWQAIELGWDRALEFLGSQIAAFGPVFGVAYLIAAFRTGRAPEPGLARQLLLFSAAIFLLVAVQALIRHANANWAAPAFVAGVALAAPWLYLASRRWFAAGLAINLVIALALPVTTTMPDRIVIGGENPFARTFGVADLSRTAIALAGSEGLEGVAAGDRMILADLVYRAKGSGIEVYAYPVPEVPNSHYALTRPLRPEAGPVLFVAGRYDQLPEGCEATQLGTWTTEVGRDRIKDIRFYRLERPC